MLLLWSAGCDSTLALHNALIAYKNRQDAHTTLPRKDGDKPEMSTPTIENKEIVRTISIIHPNTPAPYEQQNARLAIIKALKKQGHEWPHIEITITHQDIETKKNSSNGCQGAGPNGGLTQPLIWVPIANVYLHGDEDLALGYIKSDDAQYYLTTLRAAFDNLQWISGRTGKLLTPLDCTSKAEIIHHLKKADLYKHTWHCEDPHYKYKNNKQHLKQIDKGNGTPCGKCTPCIVHQTALWQLKKGYCPIGIGANKPKLPKGKKLKTSKRLVDGVPVTTTTAADHPAHTETEPTKTKKWRLRHAKKATLGPHNITASRNGTH